MPVDVDGSLRLVYIATDEVHDHETIKKDLNPSLWDHLDEIDGVAVYELDYVKPNNARINHRIAQPFARDGHKTVAGQNVWEWDGDPDNPTLSPSFGWGDRGDGWLIHLHLTDGRVEPVGDMVLDVERGRHGDNG